MLRPSAAIKVMPWVSEPVSIARTPVLSAIMLMALTVLARVSRGLLNTELTSALAKPLIMITPLTTDEPVIA